ncbi:MULTISPECIES: LysR family transcriptional regulator [unclassified Chelatococcus]|uniref:LysR family transcriptional regulator n=1 Tax=unclassified Chelatococcus TaxID=2638111 RepID=UPI001BCC6A8C|nr:MULTISPECIES: LysR family transcriptional regulator [unclassified Chelatococcus]MBS7696802.1 LysR family transcriptional regulator [Chelatococcus sp. YT9]MBX3558360.1 LysR family transcriptional regulator [Chelatococcus sp.]
MDLAAVAVLVETASAGSLAGAARRLRIPPMTATRLLAALERELGVRLVQRTTRSLSLTAEGQAFLPHAQALVEGEAAALASLRGTTAGASGLLRLTASLAFGRQVVAPLVVEFMSANPEVKVDLLLTDSLVDVVAQGIDLAVRIADLADSNLIAKRLADNPRLLVASPAYIERFGVPAELAGLQRHECLTVSASPHWDFRAADTSRRVQVLGRFTANSIDAIHEACRGGLGIANLSRWDVLKDLKDGALVAISLADAQPEPLSIWAVYPTRRMVPTKVRLFIDALSEHLKSRD